MQIFKFLLVLVVFLTVAWLSINTLTAQKIIPLNPVAIVGLPTTTWSDAGSTLQSGFQNFNTSQSITSNGWLNSTWQSVQKELGALGTQTTEVAKHAQNVTGGKELIGVANPTNPPAPQLETTSTSESAKPASQTSNQITPTPEPFYTKALDYSKYVYCQEVVRDYELQHPEVKK